MKTFLTWLQHSSFPAWIVQSDSIWAYPSILFLHNMAMALVAGSAFVVCLRLVGVAAQLPASALRILFRFFWGGFYLGLVTGLMLYASAATTYYTLIDFYVKIALIVVGLFIWVRIRAFVDNEDTDGTVPTGIKMLAAVSLAVWVGVITTGRLIAYLK